jgi:hypothetical protein
MSTELIVLPETDMTVLNTLLPQIALAVLTCNRSLLYRICFFPKSLPAGCTAFITELALTVLTLMTELALAVLIFMNKLALTVQTFLSELDLTVLVCLTGILS